jgi:hypothetical protein
MTKNNFTEREAIESLSRIHAGTSTPEDTLAAAWLIHKDGSWPEQPRPHPDEWVLDPIEYAYGQEDWQADPFYTGEDLDFSDR